MPSEELRARMRRFQTLLVLRTDGYLVEAVTGRAVQHVGPVTLEDGGLYAGGLPVGSFFAVRNRYLYPVDSKLGIHPDTVMALVYAPDEGTVGPMLEGAGNAVVDTVEGVVTLVVHPIDTVAGLAQLPKAVRTLIENSPEYWERFRVQPRAAQVRAVSRLIANLLIVFGTAGTGGAGAASAGGKLGSLSVPVLSLSAEGVLAVRVVAVPAGRFVSVVGAAPTAAYVLHMANVGAGGGGGAGQKLPVVTGPGRWKQVKPSGSERAQRFHTQVTGRPASEVYQVGDVEYDGFLNGFLQEAKGPGYLEFFNADGTPKAWYEKSEKFQELLSQAERQSKMAEQVGFPVRWYVAEREVAGFLVQYFKDAKFKNIEVIYTAPIP